MSLNALYTEVSRWYAILPPIVSAATFFINAPFGRFALSDGWSLQFDGIKSWIIMEVVSPAVFLYSLLRAPLATSSTPSLRFSLHDPRFVLTCFYLIHYANRALVSPLRSPGRSKAHISVTLSGIIFNLVNGFLMGSYLSSSACAAYVLSDSSSRGWQTLSGVVLFATGLLGNIHHDEILYDLRRNAMKKKEEAKARGDEKAQSKPHYAIPHGGLYGLISYPNYFCEWIEWTGFAVVAAPFPSLSHFTSAAPPWLFLSAEFFVMAPRAYRGHQWYHEKFPDTYPKERRAVIPFIF